MVGPKTIDELHETASRPNVGVIKSLRELDGDVMVVGAGGKMGFHLALMLKRGLELAESSGQVIAVSRFGSPGAIDIFHRHGIDTIQVDLTKNGAVNALPDAAGVFFLAGVKFGTSSRPELLQQIKVIL